MNDGPNRNGDSSQNRAEDGRLRLMALSVFLLAVLVYLPKITNGFTFDDHPFILHNPQLRTTSGVLEEFTQGQANLYRPLRSATLALLVNTAGLTNAFPYHLAGILLHAALSLLVFWIVRSILARPRLALIAGLIFAAHPVHADRVANITGSFDLLGLLFAYLAWGLALSADRRRRDRPAIAAAVFLLLGCLASEEAVMILPLVAGSFALYRGPWRRRLLILSGLAAATLAYLLVRTHVLGAMARTAQYAAGDLGASIRTMAVVVWRYLYLLIWPIGLSPAYGPRIFTQPNIASLAGLAGLLGLAVLMILARRRQPAISLAIGWFFLALLPFSNLLPSDTLMSERYLYAPLGGFAVAVGALFSAPFPRRRLAAAILALLLICLSWGTAHRCRLWGDPPTLWAQAAELEPGSFLANLRSAYYAGLAGRPDLSQTYARRAMALQPDRPEPRLHLAEIANRRGRHLQALAMYRETAALAPDNCPVLAALAQGYIMADSAFSQSADFTVDRLTPLFCPLCIFPARVGARQQASLFPQAEEAALRALRCDAGQTAAHYFLAYVLAKRGQCKAAAPHWEKVLQAEPRAAEYEAARQLIEWCDKRD